MEITFVANHIPPLKDNTYSLELIHNLSYGSTTQTASKTRSFVVAGERFSLKPDQISKQFPPANAQGHFDNVLPHVVLTRRTLPWERAVTESDNNASWLALLVFNAANAPTPITGTLADLYPASNTSGGGTLTSDIGSYGSALEDTEAFLGYGESAADNCSYIELSKSQFAQLAPSLQDLSWNAHGRTVTITDSTNEFAAVVANNLPTAGQQSTVHLVSLEGLGAYLPDDDGTLPAAFTFNGVRLVTLYSWSFLVAPEEASFCHLLLGLNGGVNSTNGELNDSQLRLPAGFTPAVATSSAAKLPFASGYTVLAGQDALVDNTYWYRGPLSPSTITPSQANSSWSAGLLPADHANDLPVTVAATPTTDSSLAAAWQLGRLMALADKNFAMAQVSWKREARLALNTALNQDSQLNLGSRTAYAAAVKTVLADVSKIQHYLGTTLTTQANVSDKLTIPQTLVDWLGKLALLQNVPANYLMPDASMLPTETLKFFSVDPKWLACLLDGAWSLDRQPAAQWAFDTAYQPWQQIQDGSLKTSFLADETAWPSNGLILNSALVPDYWPGIQFLPTPAANNLQTTQLSPSCLMLLFDGSFTSMELRQPPESLHFGFDMNYATLSKPLKYVSIDNTLYPSTSDSSIVNGSPASTALSSIPQRAPGFIQFDQLAQAMQEALGVTTSGDFSGAEFAMELVETDTSVTFKLPQGA